MIEFRYLPERPMNWDLGYLPGFFDEADPRPAAQQANANYSGGWRPQPGFEMRRRALLYPGDPPLRPVAEAKLRDEVILLYPYSYVAIIQPDGSFEVCRMD